MRVTITFLFFLFLMAANGQETIQANFSFSHNGKWINSGDYIDIYELKNIQLEHKTDTNEYEVLFVIIPFEGTMLSFSKKESEINSLDIVEMLKIGNITIENIKDIMLYVRKNEFSLGLYSVNIFTRKLETPDDYFNEFVLYAKIGEGETSIWCINQAIQMDSTNLKYLNARAQYFFETGELSSAQIDFQKIAKLQANYTSFIFLAMIELNQGDYFSCKSLAQKSLELAVTDLEKSNAYLTIGNANAKTNDYDSAYIAYKKSIELNPKNTNALNNITTVLDKLNRSDEKMNYFEQLLKADSSFYLIHINIGFHYLKLENFELALREFNSVLEIDSNQTLALSNKAFTLMKLGDLNEALEFINKSIQLDPSNAYAHKNKALIFLELGHSKSACVALKEAIKLNFTEQYGDEVLMLLKKNCQ